jgi:hypothetical protein
MINPVLARGAQEINIPVDYEVFATDSILAQLNPLSGLILISRNW